MFPIKASRVGVEGRRKVSEGQALERKKITGEQSSQLEIIEKSLKTYINTLQNLTE